MFVYDYSLCLFLLVVTMLNKEIDSDSGGVPKHLGEIAESIAEWEGKIAEELGLTEADVADIKYKWPSGHRMQM